MQPIDVGRAIPEGGFLHGWLQYCRAFEFPDSYGIFALLAGASIAINRRILVNPGGEPEVWTNLFVVLMGPAGARKGTAIRHANKVLGEADRKWGEVTPILPRTFTMEAAFNRLVKDSEASGKGSGMIISHELKRLLGGDEYMLKNVDLLTDIWDCDDPFTRETIKHEYQEIQKPYIVLQAAAQPDLMEQRMSQEMFATGFLRRILLVSEYGPKKFEAAPQVNTVLKNALTEVFAERLAPAAFEPTLMKLSERAKERKAWWYEQKVQPIWRAAGEKEGQFASCMEAHALKLAAIVSVLETGRVDELQEGSLRIGQELLEAIIPHMFQAYAALAPTPFARLRSAMLRTIRSAGGKMSEAALEQAIMRTAGAKPAERAEAFHSLVNDGSLKIEEGKVQVTR